MNYSHDILRRSVRVTNKKSSALFNRGREQKKRIFFKHRRTRALRTYLLKAAERERKRNSRVFFPFEKHQYFIRFKQIAIVKKNINTLHIESTCGNFALNAIGYDHANKVIAQ